MSAKPVISVIDDDMSLCTALVGLFRSLGYAARAFGSAEEFLAAAETCNFACVISDIHMPGISGIELKRQLDARDCAVPMIMITGRADPQIEENVAASGAMCLLMKPFETSVLIRCVEQALEPRRSGAEDVPSLWE